jgi:hypothetical protein
MFVQMDRTNYYAFVLTDAATANHKTRRTEKHCQPSLSEERFISRKQYNKFRIKYIIYISMRAKRIIIHMTAMSLVTH